MPSIIDAILGRPGEYLRGTGGEPDCQCLEMGHPTLDTAVAQIASVEEYQQAFQRVFGRPPNGPDLLRAISSYEPHNYLLILRLIGSSPATTTRLTLPPSVAGNSSTLRPAAINVMR